MLNDPSDANIPKLNSPGEYLNLEPIGWFSCPERYTYDSPRQGILGPDQRRGVIWLKDDSRLRAALRDLAGFDRIWLIYWFHQNKDWRPQVRPPRPLIDEEGRPRPVGLFATRSPYRPNPLGLCCVRLMDISPDSGKLLVADYDLINGTPILDIKPYIPYADSFPDAATGWLEDSRARAVWTVRFSELVRRQLDWLAAQPTGLSTLEFFCRKELEFDPENQLAGPRRVSPPAGEGEDWVLAYRTWRVYYRLYQNSGGEETAGVAQVVFIKSGYTEADLAAGAPDPYQDKELHRAFISNFAS